MAFKFTVFAAIIATTRAGVVGYSSSPGLGGYQDYDAPVEKVIYQPSSAKGVYQQQQQQPANLIYQQPESPKVVYQPQRANLVYQNQQQPESAKVVYQPEQPEPAHYNSNPQYTFNYDVQDGLTGDNKSQYETREGDVVKGSYSVIEADGTKRIVDYTADPKNGFNAVVRREPANVKAVVPAPKISYAPATPVHSYYNH